MEWMYKGPGQSSADKEEYLLGKPIDKTFEESHRLGGSIVDATPAPLLGKIRSESRVDVDLARKVTEDPLVKIRLAERDKLKHARDKYIAQNLGKKNQDKHVKQDDSIDDILHGKLRRFFEVTDADANMDYDYSSLNSLVKKMFKFAKKRLADDSNSSDDSSDEEPSRRKESDHSRSIRHVPRDHSPSPRLSRRRDSPSPPRKRQGISPDSHPWKRRRESPSRRHPSPSHPSTSRKRDSPPRQTYVRRHGSRSPRSNSRKNHPFQKKDDSSSPPRVSKKSEDQRKRSSSPRRNGEKATESRDASRRHRMDSRDDRPRRRSSSRSPRRENRSYGPRAGPSSSDNDRQVKKKLSDSEKEQKRLEMLANANWREQHRRRNVESLEEQEAREARELRGCTKDEFSITKETMAFHG